MKMVFKKYAQKLLVIALLSIPDHASQGADLESLDSMSGTFANIPQHIAIIMDGNGRWATRQNQSAIAGHQAGAEALKKTCEAAYKIGVKYMTVYAFSSENWKRPTVWVDDLMQLMGYYLSHEVSYLKSNNVRLSTIGDLSRLKEDIKDSILKAQDETKGNTGLNLIVALNYGGRNEIVHATQLIAEKVKDGTLDINDITPDLIASHLYTQGIPDPDLLIRTSGEQRLSNFLLWQLSYTEMVFIEKLWPDFTSEDLMLAIKEFNGRDRRYGAVFGI